MLRHVCVVSLALLLAMNLGGLLVQETEAANHGWGNRDPLVIFPYEGAGPVMESFHLQWDPEDIGAFDFDRYVFELRADDLPATGGGGIAVFYVQVNNIGTGDVICRGVLGDFFGFNAHLYCDDLRQGHHYDITIIATLPADLALSGVNPIGP